MPTGLKWRAAAEQPEPPKYIVVNEDEGDAGAFSVRFLMEDDPHALTEGMAIAMVRLEEFGKWLCCAGGNFPGRTR